MAAVTGPSLTSPRAAESQAFHLQERMKYKHCLNPQQATDDVLRVTVAFQVVYYYCVRVYQFSNGKMDLIEVI